MSAVGTPGKGAGFRVRLARQIRISPYPAGLGIRIDAVARGAVTLSFAPVARHTQYQGIAHGGALTALADTAATFACNSALAPDEDSVTIELKMNFLAPVRPAGRRRVVARARLLHRGRRTAVAEARVFDASGRLACAGVFTMLIVPAEAPVTPDSRRSSLRPGGGT